MLFESSILLQKSSLLHTSNSLVVLVSKQPKTEEVCSARYDQSRVDKLVKHL